MMMKLLVRMTYTMELKTGLLGESDISKKVSLK